MVHRRRGRQATWVVLGAMLLALVLGAAGYTVRQQPEGPGGAGISDVIPVTTTTGQIADLVRNVGGEHVAVTALMGPGIDPHLYRPSAGDVERLQGAEIIFYNGLELEGRMADTLEQLGRSGKPTFAVAENIPEDLLRSPPEFEGKHDPHIWFDVTLWMMAVDVVHERLAALAPNRAADFEANAAAYKQQLTALHEEVQRRIASIPEENRILVTAHDAFGYFGARYGLEVRGLQGISTASEASANDVQALADFIAARRIPAIFVESSVSPATVRALQEATEARGWKVTIGEPLFSDAMGAEGTPEGTYIGMFRHNVEAIVSALAPGTATNQENAAWTS